MSNNIDRGPLVKMLLDVPLFEDLDYTQVGAMIDIATLYKPAPGEVVCQSRTVDESLLVLLEGVLRLESASGKYLESLYPVRVLGEMGVFTGQVRSSRVVAEEGTQLMMIPALGLQELLDEDPQFAHHLLSSLIKLLYMRLHDVNEDMMHTNEMVARLKNRVCELSPDDPLILELFPE